MRSMLKKRHRSQHVIDINFFNVVCVSTSYVVFVLRNISVTWLRVNSYRSLDMMNCLQFPYVSF